jgi:hypothetical protein
LTTTKVRSTTLKEEMNSFFCNLSLDETNMKNKTSHSNIKTNPIKMHFKIFSFAVLAVVILFQPAKAQTQNQIDPPSRVASVSYAFGNISFADAGSNEWTPLSPNRPISTGDSIFVPDRGRAELHVGSNALRLSEETRISFIELSDDTTQIQLSQGSISIHVRALFDKERFDVSTPNLIFSIQEPGEYRINVNDDDTTTVIVRRGIGIAQGNRDVITLSEGEQTRFIGTNLRHTQITRAPGLDTFDLWALDRSRSEENSISARYVSREVIGYQKLDNYGSWSDNSEYGAVWYPRGVSSNWAPYRDGKWVWVSPWGWTWVDSAPWGFAPYHYGRWAHIQSRWAWIPGKYHHNQRPIYAPALVAFIGSSGNGVNVGISINSSRSSRFDNSVSWFPLGPHEYYNPSYTRNPHYIRNLNQTIVNNTTIINGNNNQVYINQNVNNAVTTVPTRTFVRGERITPSSSSILSGQVRQLQAITQAPNIDPEKGNRYGDARRQNQTSNNINNTKPTETATVYGSGIYAGGSALPVTPRPNEDNARVNRDDRPNRQSNNGFSTQNSNATISTEPVVNNSRNNTFRTIEENNDKRGQVRFNSERFDPNAVSENTRRNEAYRGTPNNPRAENAPIAVAPQDPAQLQTVPFPRAIQEERNNERNAERNAERSNERAISNQRFKNVERAEPVIREEREIRVQREVPQSSRVETRAQNIEMRAPREAPQAARVEPRQAPVEVRREAPTRPSGEKPSSKNEKINIE